MALAFRAVAAFNTATAVWLGVMFLILRHPGYAGRAAVAFAIAACCLAACAASRHSRSWHTTVVKIGSVLLGIAGVWVIAQDLVPGANFEGFLLIIGAGWVAQGLLALPRSA